VDYFRTLSKFQFSAHKFLYFSWRPTHPVEVQYLVATDHSELSVQLPRCEEEYVLEVSSGHDEAGWEYAGKGLVIHEETTFPDSGYTVKFIGGGSFFLSND
jgi:hypothetical protein